VVIKKHGDILRVNNISFFIHATSRKRNHDELCKIIRLLHKIMDAFLREIEIITELHK
jgi:hypothetical protein